MLKQCEGALLEICVMFVYFFTISEIALHNIYNVFQYTPLKSCNVLSRSHLSICVVVS
jgi:hypothetical protein